MTDTNKWDDPWFLDLSSEHRMAWIYILDKCTHAGIWKVNKRLAEFIIGGAIDWGFFLTAAGARIVPFSNGEKWFVQKFIEFQYGTLQETNRVHFSVIEELKREGLYKALISPLQGAKEKEKEKEKEKDLARIVIKARGDFDLFWKIYPKKKSKGDAEKAWGALKPDDELEAKVLAAVEQWKKSEDWQKDGGKFIPYPASWLRAKGWEDEKPDQPPDPKLIDVSKIRWGKEA